MSVIFIANVGNRDVQFPGSAEMLKAGGLGARGVGEMILAEWDTYGQQLELPILGKALDWVARTHKRVDRVVLIASDQGQSAHRVTDTVPFAQVMQRVFSEDPKWKERIAPEGVIIETVSENPADYDAMITLYDELMRRLDGELPADLVYLEITGGTPAMSSMLLLKGIEKFGERAQPLYVVPGKTMPRSLNIGRQLTVDAVIGALERSLAVNQYHAALELLDARAELLREEWRNFWAVRAVIEYARQRLNFNFAEAEAILFNANRGLSDSLAARIDDLARQIQDRDALWLIREEIFGAQIDFKNGAYKDGVFHIFAFREAVLRDVAKQRGCRLVDNDRKLNPDWLATEPELAEYLTSKAINRERGVTTFVFERILGFWAKTDQTLAELVAQIDHFKDLAEIRNTSAHTHGGVSAADIAEAYPGGVEQVLHDLQELYAEIAGQAPGPNPYDAINALVLDLIQDRA